MSDAIAQQTAFIDQPDSGGFPGFYQAEAATAAGRRRERRRGRQRGYLRLRLGRRGGRRRRLDHLVRRAERQWVSSQPIRTAPPSCKQRTAKENHMRKTALIAPLVALFWSVASRPPATLPAWRSPRRPRRHPSSRASRRGGGPGRPGRDHPGAGGRRWWHSVTTPPSASSRSCTRRLPVTRSTC